MFVYMIVFGALGIISKKAVTDLDWPTALTYVWGTAFVCNSIFVFQYAKIGFSLTHAWAILGGILASVGTILFYRALALAPAHKVIPSASLKDIFVVILAIVILREKMSVTTIIGVCMGLGGLVLIYWK